MESTAAQNSTILTSVAGNVELLSERLKSQVDEVTNFTTQTTENFKQILEQIKVQFQSLEKLPDSFGASFDTLNQKVTEVSSTISETAMQQQELSNELVKSVVTLRQTFSEQSLENISASIAEAEERMRSMSQGLEKREETFNGSIEKLEGHLKNLDETASSVGEFGDRIQASAQSVDEANSEYIEELSKAADTLRKETESS